MRGNKRPGPVGGLVPGIVKINHLNNSLKFSIFQHVVLNFNLPTPQGVAALAVLLFQGVQA